MGASLKNLVVDAAAIGTFAQLGCLLRTALTDWLDNCPTTSLTEDLMQPCLTSSYSLVFTSLPANMLACLIMGLIAPSSLFAKPGGPTAQAAVLPSGWGVQQYSPLWKGLSTGFLGSLSTFASWNLQIILMIPFGSRVLGHSVLHAVFGYIFGTVLSIGMLVFGAHVAEAMYSVYQRGASPGEPSPGTADSRKHWGSKQYTPGDGSAPAGSAQAMESGRGQGHHRASCDGFCLADALVIVSFVAAVACCVACMLLLPSLKYRTWATACLIGPLGAWLRWALSLTNPPFPENGQWIPKGTLAANIMATVFDTIVIGIHTNVMAVPGLHSELWAHFNVGLVTGFGGCLSTVSTFAMEAYKLLKKPHPGYRLYGYAYTALSLVAAFAFGLTVYTGIIVFL